MIQRRRPRHLEESLQTTCVQWFRWKFPGRLILAIPNGGKRNPREAGRLKVQGVLAGIPDLFIPEPYRGKPGLWIEMKSENGTVSAKQFGMLEVLRAKGYEVAVCNSFESFKKTVMKYFGELKDSPPGTCPRPSTEVAVGGI